MLRQNLILFFRNIKKHKSTFLINIIGLSSGLACVFLIALWVLDEIQVDRFHENDEYLYQVWNKFESREGPRVLNWTPNILAETMANKLPEVKYAVSQTVPAQFAKVPLHVNNKVIKTGGVFAGKDYFNMFSYPLIQGDKDQVLEGTNSIVISESLANQLFGSLDRVIGKVIEWDAMGMLEKHQVSGVFKDIPSNSTTQFDFILPLATYKKGIIHNGEKNDWVNNNPITYILLNEGTNVEEFAAKIENFSKLQNKDVTADLIMTKYSSNYLYGNFENGKQVSGRMNYIYLFSCIALFILIIACINFMNLSTANASRRLKEIGVKKALGSKRTTLITQYFGESVMTAFISLLLALLVVFLFIPQFNIITGKALSLSFDPLIFGLLLLIALFTGILAGSYPALHLSRFKPVTILRGQLKNSWGEVWVRKGLVIFQFSLSIILIIAVLLVSQQVAYVQSKNLGMDKDNVVYFRQEGHLRQNAEAFLEELKGVPNVVNAAMTSQNIIGTNINTTGGLVWTGNEEERQSRFKELRIGHDFIETMDMKLKEGRSFSRQFPADSAAIVFNETAIKMMGIENPIGKTIRYGSTQYSIIGVLNDFHFQSFREVVHPMFFRLNNNRSNLEFVVRIAGGTEKETLAKLKASYAKFNPGYVFEHRFLDADFQAQYASEQQVVSLSKYFAGLAILISCLGLFGLARHTAERRRKEISIRKVLGQSASQITMMLSGEFTKLVLIAIGIAVPVAYVLGSNWLSGFAYRIPLKGWYFIGAGCIALFVALLTVGSQAIGAANKNPVDGLKEE
ncbi:ABC transporter permease [Aquimarina megaterium]|uniref:ABC transporter permease n=1 Tax=Aquimarina megaterium TaxID=1443666 RepID=UPI0009432F7A|nr:ABC transporter permease [Aquimarina megaterium]